MKMGLEVDGEYVGFRIWRSYSVRLGTYQPRGFGEGGYDWLCTSTVHT